LTRQPRPHLLQLVSAGLCAALAAGCSVRTLAVNSLADALAESGSVYASDSDPELVRDALPFALKTHESLLETAGTHQGLLKATCSGFTQYAYAFVETDSVLLEFDDYSESRRLAERALGLYLRARDYCLRGLEVSHPGIGAELVSAPDVAVARLGIDDVDLVYWTAAAWGSAISLGLHRLEIAADLPAVRALFDRALTLDETYSRGAVHEALISIEALPETMGGSRERADRHFARAVELSRGGSAAPYVSYASAVLVPAQERAVFMETLETALAVDVDGVEDLKLSNRIARKRARFLAAHGDDLFLEPLENIEP